MSQFLMVIPQGWTEIPEPATIYSMDTWQSCTVYEARYALEAAGLCPVDWEVVDKRVFKDGDVDRLWVLMQPE